MEKRIQARGRCAVENSCCASCQSENQKTFTSEMAVHFPGIEGLNKPIVWIYPRISVCLDCGMAQFMIPDKELEVLQTGSPVEGAPVWLGGTPEY